MTDTEIIKVLEHCAKSGGCRECPMYDRKDASCLPLLIKNALELINRQKAEIERLTIKMNAFGLGMKRLAQDLETAKSEAIREFAERLKKQAGYFARAVLVDDIDNIVKEMTEDSNG